MTVDQSQRSAAWKAWLVHSLRVLLLAAILGLIHRQQNRFNAAHEALPQIPLQKVQALFPTATRLQPAEEPGTLEVLDGHGAELGRVLQTAPDSDPFRGFSGPTNLLIAFGSDDRIVGVSVLSSRDTRDHVALIERDPQFFSQWVGLTSQEAVRAKVDGVTGATLTSLAIVQGLQKRLGAATVATKFPQPLTVEDAQKLFPSAAAVTPDTVISSLWHASDAAGQPVGSVLRTSPAADEIIGYQGPTESHIGIAPDGTLTAVTVGASFDNEPYVTYVRDDDYFRSLFAKYKLPELALLDLQAAGVEGVSGATMTSLAVARSLVKAAADLEQQRSQSQHTPDDRTDHTRTILSVAIIALGLLLGLTRLKGYVWLRRSYQVLLIVVLGLVHGELLSLAMFVGWAQSGLPRQALGLIVLSIAAFAVPIVAKQNIYCSHLCPHGAVQQLLPRRFRYAGRLPKWLQRGLLAIRPLLLAWVVFVTLTQAPFSLVDIEPFDAYAWRAAAWPTCAAAVVGLVASLFVPMAYCRFGCPTGAVLDYVRRHSRSDQLTRSDLVAVVCLVFGVGAGEVSWSRAQAVQPATAPVEKSAVSGRTMGTSWSVLTTEHQRDKLQAAQSAIQSQLDLIESTFSLYQPDSALSRFNRDPSGVMNRQSPAGLVAVTLRAIDLSRRSRGAFDPTIGPLSRLWKLRELSADWQPPTPAAIDAARQSCGIDQLGISEDRLEIRKTDPDVELDLNALVEGYALEQLAEVLRSAGIDDALIEVGGESLAIGNATWAVGVSDPLDPSRLITQVNLHQHAISTSGTTRQRFQVGGRTYSHIIDPRTGAPVEHSLLSVTVIDSDPMTADGWATALMVLGPVEGPQLAEQLGLVAFFVSQGDNEKAVIQRTTAFARFEKQTDQ